MHEPLTSQLPAYMAGVNRKRFLNIGAEAATAHHFVLEMDDPWLPKVDLVQARNIILNFNSNVDWQRLEWPLKHLLSELTGFDLAPAFNKLDEETAEFVVERGLTDSVAWLQASTPRFFDGTDFEIDLLPAEDGEENLLALKVYGAFSSSEFRNRRHRICEAMLAGNHRTLYEVISIFQRRVTGSGWQTFSWYSSLSAE